MKAEILNLKMEKINEIELPKHFTEEIRPDLIKRAFLAIMSRKRVPYGSSEIAGKKHSVRISKRRRDYRTSYGRGISRIPKKILWRRGLHFYWVGAFAPGTVGGRKAHPPKPEKIFYEKINKKERLKAIRSAIAATAKLDLVRARHRMQDISLPVIIEDIEHLKRTKEFIQLLKDLGLEAELKRCEEVKIRAGKGKMRNRKYRKKKGPLFVFSSNGFNNAALKSSSNIQGVEAVNVKNLNIEMLAPGGIPGRLTIWSSKAIQDLEKLFGVENG